MATAVQAYTPAAIPLANYPGNWATQYYRGTSQTWGQTQAISAGVRRMSGYPIWLQGYQTYNLGGTVTILSVVNADGTTTTTRTIVGGKTYATWAVSFGYPLNQQNPWLRNVTRLWANGRLI